MARSVHDWQGPTPEVAVRGRAFRLPIHYHDTDLFQSVHTASYEAVAAELPGDLRPARWIDGRAMLAVLCFRYRDVTVVTTDGSTGRFDPYGEIAVNAVVTRGPAARLMPLLGRQMRGFVLHLPVTTREAHDAGRQLWGFPKFVADMDFAEEGQVRGVELSENGRHILTVTVRPGGPVLADHRPLIAYTTLGGQLLETVVPAAGHVRFRPGREGGRLDLGEHPVADHLRRLGISAEPVAVFSYLDHRSVLPAGVPIGPARDYTGYSGDEREFGRFTVSYPGTAPLDQYAPAPARQLSVVGA